MIVTKRRTVVEETIVRIDESKATVLLNKDSEAEIVETILKKATDEINLSTAHENE